MAYVLLHDARGPLRDALAFVLTDARLAVRVAETEDEVARSLADPECGLLIIGEHDEAVWRGLRPSIRSRRLPVIAIIDPGDFRKIIAALCLGATDVVSRDRSARTLVARAAELLASGLPEEPVAARTDELIVELEGRTEQVTVSTEWLLSLIAQVCEDALRLRKRYEAELDHRRRVEHALMESEAFYQSLVETLPMALFRKDLEGRVTFANRRLCETVEHSLSELVGKTDFDLFPAELAEKYRADDRRVLDSRCSFETTEQFRGPHGEERYTHVIKTPVVDASGRAIGIQGVFSDVTEQVKAEQALERERYLLDNLMLSSPDNIYFKDAEGRYLRINPAKAANSGLSKPEDAVGKSDRDFFAPEHAAIAQTDEQQVMATGQPLIGKEERNVYPDGRVRWMSTTKLPLRDRDGRIIGTFGVSRDITPLKAAQQAWEEAAAAADAANRAKSDFLANMSHEIRTPLNAILGMTELVLETPLTPVQRDYLKLVNESGEALLTVINDILDFSKIEAGKLQLDQTPFELREFLGDTLKSIGLRAHRKGLELACDVEHDVGDLLIGDPHRLRQIVINLVGNAIKFTDQGEIVISVHRGPDPAENVQLLQFSVADTGIGIPPDKFQTIFEAFEQADRSTTRKFGGTGLGLAISARLVELMGGRIWVESEVGRGSTFSFSIPFQLSADQPTRSTASPELLQGLRVLVVDDNATNRRILAEMLTSWGMAPILVANADEALAEMNRQHVVGSPFALVVTDVNMPGASGFDLVQTAQSAGLCAKGVIVMLTSGDRSEDMDLCQKLGVSTYLIKPIKQSELFNAILQALGELHHEEWKSAQIHSAPQASRPLHVLLAEDSTINQKLAIGLLERWGHRVTVANDGREAVERSANQTFDLILMDIQMPELDGLDATRAIRLREAETGGHLPILAMTAHALQGDRERCLDAGMDDYITKPIRSNQLFELLERYASALPPARATAEGDRTDTTASAVGGVSSSAAATANPTGHPLGPAARPSASRPAQPMPPEAEVADSVLVVIDWNHAGAATGGDEGLLRDVADAFAEETPQLLERARQALAAGQWTTLQRTAHTMKSAFATFGVREAQTLAAALEAAAKSQAVAQGPATLDTLAQFVAGTIRGLRHRFPAESP